MFQDLLQERLRLAIAYTLVEVLEEEIDFFVSLSENEVLDVLTVTRY